MKDDIYYVAREKARECECTASSWKHALARPDLPSNMHMAREGHSG